MQIDSDMIEHMDHVALDIDPKDFIGGAIITKREAGDLTILAGRLFVTAGYGQEISEALMSMLKPKEYEPEPNLG